MNQNMPCIAVIGGTGSLGGGLAFRWAKAGYRVVIGSRSREKAEQACADILEKLPSAKITGCGNQDAASRGDIVVLTVPYSHHESSIREISDAVQGKIFVDTTVPLVPPKVARVQLSADWPVAGAAQTMLGEAVRVVSAFHNVAAAHLHNEGDHDDGDVLVFGNSKAARESVIELVSAVGLKGWHAGSIHNSVVGEALTSVLIFLNKNYQIDGSGIRITGNPA